MTNPIYLPAGVRELLEELQWHYEPYDDYYHRDCGYYCPSCGGEKGSGHREGCPVSAILSRPQPVCTWVRDEDTGAYETACDSVWHYTDGGTPEENGQYFCHHCGKPLEEAEASNAKDS